MRSMNVKSGEKRSRNARARLVVLALAAALTPCASYAQSGTPQFGAPSSGASSALSTPMPPERGGFGAFSAIPGAASSAPAAPAVPAAPSTQFVLTRSGAITEGTVVDRGESYSIEFAGGGSISASKLDVLFIGDTREEVYAYKERTTRLEDVNEVMRLADWAVRRQLSGEALDTLRRRLETSVDAAEQRALTRKIEELEVVEARRADAARALAAHEQRVRERQNAAAAASADAGPGKSVDAELDAWGRTLPPAALERFSRKALPVVQKRCGKSGCHEEGTPGAQYVVRAKAYGPAQRLALLYNLRETTAYVDFDNVDASPILDHPVVTNVRGERVYPFGADRYSARDCANFVEWLNSLRQEPKLAASAKEYRQTKGDSPALRPGAASRYDVVDVTRGGAANAQPQGGAVTGRVNANSANPANPGAPNAPNARQGFADLFGDAPEDAAARPVPGADPSLANLNAQTANGAPDANAPVFQQGVIRNAADYMPDPYDDVNSPESTLRRVGMLPRKKYRDDYDPAIFNDRFHGETRPAAPTANPDAPGDYDDPDGAPDLDAGAEPESGELSDDDGYDGGY